jgi:tetratricopeptide (TPR) repeat protein
MSSLEDKIKEARNSGDLKGVLELRKSIALEKQSPADFCLYGKAAEELKLWEEAEEAYEEALRLDPNFFQAMRCMGILLYERTDGHKEEHLQAARDWFLKALKHENDAGTLTLLGATYHALNDLARARQTFEEAIKLDPNYEEALYNLAIMERKQNPQRAVQLMERAIEIDPYYAHAHHDLGLLYHKLGDLERAEHHLRRTLETHPKAYWTHLHLANCLAGQERDDEAEEEYRVATNLRPDIPGGFEFFARFLEDIGKTEQAAEVRSKAVYGPGEPRVRPRTSQAG